MSIDDDIRAVEERIARGRNGLAALAEDCEETARDVVASPKSLLAVAAVGVGDQVSVSGVVVLNRDFGMGYSYPLLIEEASITRK